MSSLGSILTHSVTDMVKSENTFWALKSQYRDQQDLEKHWLQTAGGHHTEQQDFHWVQQITLPTVLSGCRI